jgi:hypothetical protein
MKANLSREKEQLKEQLESEWKDKEKLENEKVALNAAYQQ